MHNEAVGSSGLSNQLLEAHLTATIQESLSLFLFDNAKWLGERLVAHSASEANITLLAGCYFQSNQAYRAYHLLRSASVTSHSARYLLALCCIQLGKLNDARDALTKMGDREVPLGAAGLFLLGRVYRLVGRSHDAKEQYLRALRLNPLLWSAYEELCALGADDEAQEVCSLAASCQAAAAAGSGSGTTSHSREGRAQGGSTGAVAGGGVSGVVLGPGHNQHNSSALPPKGVLHGTPLNVLFGEGGASNGVPASGMSSFVPAAGGGVAFQAGVPASPPNLHGSTPGPAINLFASSALGAPHTGPFDGGLSQAAHAQGITRQGEAGQAPNFGAGGWQSGTHPTGGFVFTFGSGATGPAAWQTPLNNTGSSSGGLFVTPAPGVGTAAGQGLAIPPTVPVHLHNTATAMDTTSAHTSSTTSSDQHHNTQAGAQGGRQARSRASPGRATAVAGPLFGDHQSLPEDVSTVGPKPAGVSGWAPAKAFVPTHLTFTTTPWNAPPGYNASAQLAQAQQQGTPSWTPSVAGATSSFMTGTHLGGDSGAQGLFVTPSVLGGAMALPPPPQKQQQQQHQGLPAQGSQGQGPGQLGLQGPGTTFFPGFTAGMGGNEPTAPATTSHHQNGTAPSGRGGNARMLMDEGKVRKISGKSLFGDTGGGTARGSVPPSPPKRSSRLAALASAQNTLSANSSQDHQQPLGNQKQQQEVAGEAAQSGQQFSTKLHLPPVGQQGPDFGFVATRQLPAQQLGKTAEGQAQALCVLRGAYEGLRHLALYRCDEAGRALQTLPPGQLRTAWVHIQLARAHFERMEYTRAVAAFQTARQLDRYRVEGMELFSTVLWHLKRDTDLSYLAQEVLTVDRLAPQTWCVMGNLLSLQKEHDAAIRVYERALQLDPSFTYAYTLSGHEYTANEDFDKALTCYRNALRFDGRHYNAMYGVGQIYYRQEKYDLALCNFRAAANIHPRSSVLACYCGMALSKLGLHDQALDKLQEAIASDPRNPLARFEKASTLAAVGDVEGALAELQALTHVAPGEASVYFMMGRLYKRLGDLRAAQQQFETALSFNSSSADAGVIKAAIEKLSINDDQEEEEL